METSWQADISSLATPTEGFEPDLNIRLGELTLKNPVMPASGCFGPELAPLFPISFLGAVVTKTVFSRVRSGNPSHRLTETAHGMLNAVGIPSHGVSAFLEDTLPRYAEHGVPVVVSVGGLTVDEYLTAVEQLAGAEYAALEINVSCPNLEHGGLEIGAAPTQVEEVVRGVVERTEQPVIVKLTPNVAKIDDIARAAEAAGATALTVSNTVLGMAIDLRSRRPVLGNNTGGLSGPAMKPIALRLVWEAAQAVDIPIIGCGGIVTARDAAEFLVAGATAVQIGTANFTRPDAMMRVIEGLPSIMAELQVRTIPELVGSLKAH